MAIDYGRDTSVIDDVGPRDRLVSGRRNLANALARRLGTPRAALAEIDDDGDYGLDLRQLIGESLSPADERRWKADIAAECEKDSRVGAAVVSFTLTPATQALEIVIEIEPADGSAPFTLVLAISELTVEVLRVG